MLRSWIAFVGLALLCAVLQPAAAQNPAFVDVALAKGLQEPGTITRATAWEDFDNDGDLDVAFGNLFSSNRIYFQNASGQFVDVSEQVGVSGALVEDTYGTFVADYDNDGDGDIFFTNGGFNSLAVNRLYRNDLNTQGVFTEVGATAGVRGSPSNNHGAAWFDLDNDGWLDLLVVKRNKKNTLFHNQGDGTFVNIAGSAGVDRVGGANGACTADFDNDGWVDVVIPEYSAATGSQGTVAFKNMGDGTFADVTVQAGLGVPPRAFTCAVEDFDQDGFPDLYVPTFNYQSDPVQIPSMLFLNDGRGRFTLVPPGNGSDLRGNIMGLQSGDLDLDGLPDLYVGHGDPNVAAPDFILQNATAGGTVSFVDVSLDSGIHDVQETRTHGTIFVDFDRDGDLDIFAGMGGNMPSTCEDPPCVIPGQEEPNRLQERVTGSNGSWLRFGLDGVASNRDGVGTRVFFQTDAGQVFDRVRGGNGFNSVKPFERLTGLGDATQVNDVWLSWPSGIWQRLDASPGQTHIWLETGVRAHPRNGGQVEIEVVGPENVAFEVYGALQRVNSPLPAGSPLLQEPRQLLVSGTLGASNRELFTLDAPSGFETAPTIHMQVVFGSGPNLEFANVVAGCLEPAATPLLTMAKADDDAEVHWTHVPNTPGGYDVVRGDLALLRSSGGSFQESISTCLLNDSGENQALDTDASELSFYLVRGVTDCRAESFDTSAATQSQGRDNGIAASLAGCQ